MILEKEGNLTTVGAKAGQGKTSYLIKSGLKAFKDNKDVEVLYFTDEDSSKYIFKITSKLAKKMNIDFDELLNFKMSVFELESSDNLDIEIMSSANENSIVMIDMIDVDKSLLRKLSEELQIPFFNTKQLAANF